VHYEVAEVDSFGRAVSEEITRREFRPAADRIARGEQIEFGPITISRDHIGLNGRNLPWDEVSAVEDTSGRTAAGPRRWFTIKQVGNKRAWGEAEAVKVPNFWLLFALIRQLRPQVLPK
jgi:hypothetical protein